MNKKDLFSDLDLMLNKQQQEDDAPPELEEEFEDDYDSISIQPYNWPEIKVQGTSVNIVPVLIDDSYSIRDRGIEPKLLDGAKDMIDELQKIAKEQKETFFALTGFKGSYFLGDVLSKSPEEIISQIECTHTSTPLVQTALRLIETVSSAEEHLNDLGISSTVNMLLITDGLPEEDTHRPHEFKNAIANHPHWKVLGMGITRDYERRAEEDMRKFTDVFESMGIKNIVTPSSSEVKAVFSSFSKSVSMV